MVTLTPAGIFEVSLRCCFFRNRSSKFPLFSRVAVLKEAPEATGPDATGKSGGGVSTACTNQSVAREGASTAANNRQGTGSGEGASSVPPVSMWHHTV
jgi:hypothetical protein